jgi:serine/threonine-protein kinase
MNAQPDTGSTEQRLAEVLAAYLEAIDAGWAPEQQKFLDRYPELAPDLKVFFQNQDRLAHLANSLPPPYPARLVNGRGQESSGSWNPGDLPTLPQADSAPSTDPHLENVRYFDNYEILEEISRGGMGIVFRARQRGLSRQVALKMILSGQFASPAEIQRFLHESENASLLDHPNIVPIYTVGEYHGQRYFTMKLIEGGNLSNHLPHLSQDRKTGVRLLVTVAQAVHYAHQRGILHRDLKPANILVDDKGQPHITDFGLAKRIPANVNPDAANTEAGYVAPEQIAQRDGRLTTAEEYSPGQATTLSTIAGTPSYMPPEQAGMERGGLTTAADVYSLGAILYKLLTGSPPFRGTSWQDTLEKVRQDQPLAPRVVKHGIPRDLEAICLKCLNKTPEQRYASAQVLADDLERWLKGEPVEARRRSLPARLWHAVYRNALVCAATAAMGFAAGAFLLYAYLTDPDRPLKNHLHALDRGKPVQLIAETGGPAWLRWTHGADRVMASVSSDEPYSFTSTTFGQMLLLTRTAEHGYRLSADVRHDDSLGWGAAGLYFAYSTIGRESYWCEIMFADRGEKSQLPPNPINGGTSGVGLRLFHEAPGEVPVEERTVTMVGRMFTPIANKWRHLEVEVLDGRVRVNWEGENIGAITDRDLSEFTVGPIKPTNANAKFHFDPHGGLGLYVYRGTASFCNVQIEPLP